MSITDGSDFNSFTQTVTFQPGQTQLSVTVSTLEDAFKEVDETIICTLTDSPNDPTDVNIGSPNVATITIEDDDG